MSYSVLPPGVILPFAGLSGVSPSGYLLCDGSAISRTAYAALFAVIGTNHGSGDGSTTFNLPDTRGVFLRGAISIGVVSGSGTASSNQATFLSHGMRTGMRVRLTGGTLSGLSSGVNYYVISVDANTLAFATTVANAISNSRIAISGANSASIDQWVDPQNYASRVSPQAGANSSGVGSFQEDQLASHSHIYRSNENNGASNSGTSGDPASKAFFDRSSATSGGNETRPINIYINHIIKY